MAEIDDLYSALEKADAAGNAGDAREIAGMIRAMEGQSAPAAAAPAPAARDTSNDRPLTTALVNAGDAISFGAMGPVAAYIASGASRLTGNPISYEEARRRQQAHMAELNAENPTAALIGSIGGSVGGGLGLAKLAAKALPGAVRAVTPQVADSIAKKAGRLAAGGAIAGAGSNALETGVDMAEAAATGGAVDTTSKNPVSDAIVAGGLGAVAGPVVGGLVGAAARGVPKVRDLVTGNELGGGWRYLARKLDVEPGTLRGALDDYSRLTGGQRASIAQVMDMKQQGVLAELARDNPAAGVAFRQAAEEGAEALPGQVRDQVRRTVGAPRSAPEMDMATKAPADRFMADVRQRGDSTFLTTADQQALRRPDFIAATRDLPPELRSRVAAAVQGADELTTSEIDIVRRHIADWGKASAGNKGTALQMQRTLEDIAERTSPGYKAETIRSTEAGRLREEGFAAGRKLEDNTGVMGGTIRQGPTLEGYGEGVARRVWDSAGAGPKGAMSAVDEVATGRNMQDALQSAYGTGAADELVGGARALRGGQRSLETIAPGRVGASPSAGEEARGLTDVVGGGVAAVAGHPVSMTRQIMRMLPGGLSERVAGRLADDLVSTDPRRVAQAVANLRRGGADNAMIAEVQSLAARVAGDRVDLRQERRVPLQVTVRKRAGQ